MAWTHWWLCSLNLKHAIDDDDYYYYDDNDDDESLALTRFLHGSENLRCGWPVCIVNVQIWRHGWSLVLKTCLIWG